MNIEKSLLDMFGLQTRKKIKMKIIEYEFGIEFI